MKIEDCKVGMKVRVCKADAPDKDLYAWNDGMDEICDGKNGVISETRAVSCGVMIDGCKWYIPASALSPVDPQVTQVSCASVPLMVTIERDKYEVNIGDYGVVVFDHRMNSITIPCEDIEKVLDLISAAKVAYELAKGLPCDT